MTDWKHIEYETLRDEISQKIRLQNELLMFAVTTSVAVLTVIVQCDPQLPAWTYSIPIIVLFPFAKRMEYYRGAVIKISAYITTFIEGDNISEESKFPRWETRNSSQEMMEKTPTLLERFGISFGTNQRKGCELLVLSLIYSGLFVARALGEYRAQAQTSVIEFILSDGGIMLLAAILGFFAVIGIAVVSPAYRPMRKLRPMYLEQWDKIRSAESEEGERYHMADKKKAELATTGNDKGVTSSEKDHWAEELDECQKLRGRITLGGTILGAAAILMPFFISCAQLLLLSIQKQVLSMQPGDPRIAALQDVVDQFGLMVSFTPQFAVIVIAMLLVAAFLFSYGARLSRAILSDCDKHNRMAG